jgi:hypothetical protein
MINWKKTIKKLATKYKVKEHRRNEVYKRIYRLDPFLPSRPLEIYHNADQAGKEMQSKVRVKLLLRIRNITFQVTLGIGLHPANSALNQILGRQRTPRDKRK